jgi:hypothetical protein
MSIHTTIKQSNRLIIYLSDLVKNTKTESVFYKNIERNLFRNVIKREQRR